MMLMLSISSRKGWWLAWIVEVKSLFTVVVLPKFLVKTNGRREEDGLRLYSRCFASLQGQKKFRGKEKGEERSDWFGWWSGWYLLVVEEAQWEERRRRGARLVVGPWVRVEQGFCQWTLSTMDDVGRRGATPVIFKENEGVRILIFESDRRLKLKCWIKMRCGVEI